MVEKILFYGPDILPETSVDKFADPQIIDFSTKFVCTEVDLGLYDIINREIYLLFYKWVLENPDTKFYVYFRQLQEYYAEQDSSDEAQALLLQRLVQKRELISELDIDFKNELESHTQIIRNIGEVVSVIIWNRPKAAKALLNGLGIPLKKYYQTS